MVDKQSASMTCIHVLSGLRMTDQRWWLMLLWTGYQHMREGRVEHTLV